MILRHSEIILKYTFKIEIIEEPEYKIQPNEFANPQAKSSCQLMFSVIKMRTIKSISHAGNLSPMDYK